MYMSIEAGGGLLIVIILIMIEVLTALFPENDSQGPQRR